MKRHTKNFLFSFIGIVSSVILFEFFDDEHFGMYIMAFCCVLHALIEFQKEEAEIFLREIKIFEEKPKQSIKKPK